MVCIVSIMGTPLLSSSERFEAKRYMAISITSWPTVGTTIKVPDDVSAPGLGFHVTA